MALNHTMNFLPSVFCVILALVKVFGFVFFTRHGYDNPLLAYVIMHVIWVTAKIRA